MQGGPASRVAVGDPLEERDDALASCSATCSPTGLAVALAAGLRSRAGASPPPRCGPSRRCAAAPTGSPGEDPTAALPVARRGDESAPAGRDAQRDARAAAQGAFDRERRSSPTPVTSCARRSASSRTELELALRRGRSPERAATRRWRPPEETDRLIRLAEDLLVLARLDQGRLPLRAAEASTPAGCRRGRGALRHAGPRSGAGRCACRRPGRAAGCAATGCASSRRSGTWSTTRCSTAAATSAGGVAATGRGRPRCATTGRGFPARSRRAFERFARADGARSRRRQRTRAGDRRGRGHGARRVRRSAERDGDVAAPPVTASMSTAACSSHERRLRLDRGRVRPDRRGAHPDPRHGLRPLGPHLRRRRGLGRKLLPARRPPRPPRARLRAHPAAVAADARGDRRGPHRGRAPQRAARGVRRGGGDARRAAARRARPAPPGAALLRVRDPLRLARPARAAGGGRRRRRRARHAAHAARGGRPEGQELPVGRLHPRALRGLRPRRAPADPHRRRGRRHRGPGLQRLRARRRRAAHARPRRARGDHAPHRARHRRASWASGRGSRACRPATSHGRTRSS